MTARHTSGIATDLGNTEVEAVHGICKRAPTNGMQVSSMQSSQDGESPRGSHSGPEQDPEQRRSQTS